jgi:predicted phosphodiesterase
MDELNKAKAYKIYSQKFFYRGPFGAIKDAVISESYNFRPVDTSDNNLNYYALSDIHMELEGSIKAANFNKDKELLVLAGDIISLMNSHDDAFYTGKVAHELTKGEIAVVYARGNHEIKGDISEQFYKYVGSKNENFYYSFYLDNIYGLVLDMGEDHDDSYWEYYETAHFEEYQKEQVEFLKAELASKKYEDYDYKMMVCHIPVQYINGRGNHKEIKQELTSLLNQFDLDIALSGHQHDIWVFEPNTLTPMKKLSYVSAYKTAEHSGMVTDFNFPAFLISKRGVTQTDSNKLTQHTQIGLSVIVDLDTKTETVIYNSSNGNKLDIVNQFANYKYGNEIVIDLETKVFNKK